MGRLPFNTITGILKHISMYRLSYLYHYSVLNFKPWHYVLAWISPLAATASSECGQDTVAMQLFHVPVFLSNTSLYAYFRCIVF